MNAPFVETCCLVPGCRNDSTYSSDEPDSVDKYAPHRLSGETLGANLVNGVCVRRSGLRSPAVGRAQRSLKFGVPGRTRSNTTCRGLVDLAHAARAERG